MAVRDLMKGYGAENFPLPRIAGTYKGGLIVCGDAACVWDDLERFGCASRVDRGAVFKSGWHFMTVNKVVEVFPGNIEHAYSNEPWHLEAYIKARRPEYRDFSGPGNTHSCNKGAQWRWPWSGRGTSLLGGVIVGLALGYDQIVICGGPLDNGPHNGEPPWRKCRFDKEVEGLMNSHWQEAMGHFDGKVRSMSGRTRKWLGDGL